ncbi:unnamed protein product [Caenorhabditis bovis]|uniref:histone deacetylase n=1 Tax=Caenorhabditis bovis TaxID=2654633 RepID=A0A8S1ESF8_9PELO|nr:unnamed protein product [Caenorhabditis bovis]
MDEADSSPGSSSGPGATECIQRVPTLEHNPPVSAKSSNPKEQLSFIQNQLQEYRQKQMDLLGHYHRAQQELNVQHLQNVYAALQQSQIQADRNHAVAVGSRDDSGPAAPLSLASSLTNLLANGNGSVPQTPTKEKDQPAFSTSLKKCDIPRTNSTTISQHTKERIKNMIANRNRGESASQVNLTGSSNAINSSQNGTHVNVSSPHFEPYRVPSNFATAQTVQASDFQLRKVNSEPNLKMRIRAKLLSKGSSPVQQNPQNNSQFNFTHPQLKRSDSETSQNFGNDVLQQNQAAIPHIMLPSPSLPNLAAMGAFPNVNLNLDLNAFMAVANLSPFLSLPSLLNKKLELGGITDDPERSGLMGSSSTASLTQAMGLPAGHPYHSLLKQQIRDLVLRRKSLVREEPEDGADEIMNGLLPSAKLQHLQALATEAGLPSGLHSGEIPTGLAYDGSMAKHECVCGNSASHVEHGGRIQSIWSRLVERGLVQQCEKVPAKKASLEHLQLVHSPTYTTFFAVSPTACFKIDANALPVKSFVQLPCGGIGVDSDTYFNDASTQTAVRLAAGSLIELASQVAENRLKNGFACIRPPGHHAEKEIAMGFCFFNNVAICAKALQTKYPSQCARIAIIDWDVHHGNGTQLTFEDDPNVLYVSLHRHDNGNFFPGTGSVTEVGKNAGKGFTVNIPFSGGVMRDADYLAAWRSVVEPVLESYQPNFILVSAGFDAAQGHPNALGGYEISPELFGYMTKSLTNYADGKVVLALEGGYDLTSISQSAEQCVQALIGTSDDAGRLSTRALESIPCLNAQETIQKVIAIHKTHWPKLTSQQGVITSSEMQWRSVQRNLM